MYNCGNCKHSEWDYDDSNFGGPVQWFLVGCKKEVEDPDSCEEYEEFDVTQSIVEDGD